VLDLGEEAIERARAELRAVQRAAVGLAVLMARFGQDAERLAQLVHEIGAPRPPQP
jgi:hypothetical protein